jgi:PAS domain S-box-containing protein
LSAFSHTTRQKVLSFLEKGTIEVTDFYFCEQEKKVHYDIVAPIKNRNKELIGSIVFRINLESFLYPFIQSWPTPSKSSETLLLREENDSVLFLNELRHMKNTAFSLKIPLSSTDVPAVQAIMGYTGIVQGNDYRGVEVVAFVSPVENTDWYMVSKIDRSELFVDLRFKLGAIIIVTLFILLFLSAGIAWLYILRQRNIFKSMFEAREEFRTTLYSIGDAVITTDSKGNIKQMNQIAETLTGWSEKNARGQFIDNIFKIINEETKKPNKSLFHSILSKGQIVGVSNHTMLISKTGKEIPINNSGAPIKNNEGIIIGAVIVFRDQSEDRKRQKLTAKRIELLEYSTKNPSNNILTKTINEVCKFTKSTIGYCYLIEPEENAIRKCIWSAENKRTLSKTQEKSIDRFFEQSFLWTNCIRQKKPYIDNECKEADINKELIPGQLAISAYFSIPLIKSGNVVAVIGAINQHNIYSESDIEAASFLSDISWEIYERKKVEESFEEEQRILSSLISTIPDSVYFKDKDSRFIRINKAKAERMGLENPELAIGKSDADYFGIEHSTQTLIDEKGLSKQVLPL